MPDKFIIINDVYSYRKAGQIWLLRRKRVNGDQDTYHATFKRLEEQLTLNATSDCGPRDYYISAAQDEIKKQLRKTLAPCWGRLKRD